VDCTTQPELGVHRVFGHWLQLMHCANLLLLIPSILNWILEEKSLEPSIKQVQSSKFGVQRMSVALIRGEHRVEINGFGVWSCQYYLD